MLRQKFTFLKNNFPNKSFVKFSRNFGGRHLVHAQLFEHQLRQEEASQTTTKLTSKMGVRGRTEAVLWYHVYLYALERSQFSHVWKLKNRDRTEHNINLNRQMAYRHKPPFYLDFAYPKQVDTYCHSTALDQRQT